MVEVAIRQPQLPNSHMNTEGGVLISSVSVMAARNLVSLGTLQTVHLTMPGCSKNRFFFSLDKHQFDSKKK